MDGAEEGDDLEREGVVLAVWFGGRVRVRAYHGAVADLEGLEDVQRQLGGALGHDEAGARGGGVVDLPRAVDGREGGAQVREHAGKPDPVSLGRHVLQGEGVLDGFLQAVNQRFRMPGLRGSDGGRRTRSDFMPAIMSVSLSGSS